MVAIIDEEVCIGCGQCEEICPEVFEICNEKAIAIYQEIPGEALNACYEAVEICPVNAITLKKKCNKAA